MNKSPLKIVLTIVGIAGLAAGLAVCANIARATLWDEYAAAPDTHPNIPNCSFAGYHYGETPLPENTATDAPATRFAPRINVKNFAAKGDGNTDDTEAIRAALASVKPDTGGVIFFPNGRYKISGVLFVHTNKTVLRGETRDGVELIFTNPLDRAYHEWRIPPPDFRKQDRTNSHWSYMGGLIWFTPLKRGTTYFPPDTPTEGIFPAVSRRAFDGPALPLSPAKRGDNTVKIAAKNTDSNAFAAGDFVRLQQRDPGDYSLLKHLCGGGSWADAFDWQNASYGGAWKTPDPQTWIVEIAAVAHDKTTGETTLTLRQPLRFDVQTRWQPTVQKLIPLIRESGIENMTLRFLRDYTWTPKDHHKESGWNAPFFNYAVHCWLRDVTMLDMENGPGLADAKCITMTRFKLGATSPARLAHHHGTICRMSYDNLWSDFLIESQPAHGLNVEAFASGNVWMRGVLEHGVLDTHRRIPHDNLHTDITLVRNDGWHGGDGGPALGARSVEWNIRVENDKNSDRTDEQTSYMVGWANVHPWGAIVGLQGAELTWHGGPKRATASKYSPVGEGVSKCRIESENTIPTPANLYEAQLQLRLQSLREN
ncbi:glycosyl hydrolase family 28-related protein [Geminisphaera colitermitum]|uniref:glycosyl hydrolase family 28-related protein n=1 Tax=Geminisphaera colitermitum TaxID=1148786 RepID=UPI0002D6C4B6|nr:glycosyl hydrolase family 28-related protein [Geminisphaera colitermitum]